MDLTGAMRGAAMRQEAAAADQDLQGGKGHLLEANTSSFCQRRESRTSVCSLHPCSATGENTNQPWAMSLCHGNIKSWSSQAAGRWSLGLLGSCTAWGRAASL